jgi:hypothetical protein
MIVPADGLSSNTFCKCRLFGKFSRSLQIEPARYGAGRAGLRRGGYNRGDAESREFEQID